MTPDEHRAAAERLMSAASYFTADPAKDPTARSLITEATLLTSQAQVHATLALTPPPPPEKPQHKWSLSKQHSFPEGTGGQLVVTPVPHGVIVAVGDDAALMENPDVLRTLASLLTAHADRLESKP